MNRLLVICMFALCLITNSYAQNDPVLAGMIHLYTDKAENELKNQEKVMLMQSTGHIWMKEEIEGTTDLQREFNAYLSSFRSIITYAAQIYGFYYEIGRMITNMDCFTKQLDKHPDNALAVALSTNRNKIYREIILGSVEIVNDIRQVCLNDNKMTEKDRAKIVFSIRPKLKALNKKLQRLNIAVKYTSLTDIWNEIDEGSREKTDKRRIIDDCFKRWKRNGKQ